MNRLGQLLNRTAFGHKAARARIERRDCELVLALATENEHGQNRLGVLDILESIQSIPVGQTEVEQQEVPKLLAHKIERLLGVQRLFDQGALESDLQKGAERAPSSGAANPGRPGTGGYRAAGRRWRKVVSSALEG